MTSVLITHATTGVGLAIARAFAAMPNANITLHHDAAVEASQVSSAVDTVRRLMKGSGRVLSMEACLRSQDTVNGLVNKVQADFGGRLDVCVSTELLSVPRFKVLPVDATALDAWDAQVSAPLRSSFLLTAAALKPMKAQAFGRIIHLAGPGSTTGRAHAAAQATVRHGLHGLIQSAALEVGHEGVTVNGLSVGLTPGSDELEALIAHRMELTGETREEAQQAVVEEMSPALRLVEPDEIGAACLFLALPTSRSLNGAMVPLDGGFTSN